MGYVFDRNYYDYRQEAVENLMHEAKESVIKKLSKFFKEGFPVLEFASFFASASYDEVRGVKEMKAIFDIDETDIKAIQGDEEYFENLYETDVINSWGY